MLLAEALAARKDTAKEIEELGRRLGAAVVRYEDESAGDDASQVRLALGRALDRYQALTVRINRANNSTTLAFDGKEITIMEAVALRDRLTMESKALHGAVEAVEQVVGSGRRGRSWLATRRAKDDLKEIPTVDLAEERVTANRLSESIRRLDLAMQKRNWTTDIGT